MKVFWPISLIKRLIVTTVVVLFYTLVVFIFCSSVLEGGFSASNVGLVRVCVNNILACFVGWYSIYNRALAFTLAVNNYMATGKDHRGGKRYVDMYPRLRKWIQQCLLCQSEGYNPTMPDFLGISGFGPANIKATFPPLALDEEGICEQCRNAQSNFKE